MSTLVAERPEVSNGTIVRRASLVTKPDPFEGRPLARFLFEKGIPIVKSSRAIRRYKRKYKLRCVAQMAEEQTRLDCFPPGYAYDYDGNFRYYLATMNWHVHSLEKYRAMVAGTIDAAVGTELPKIPEKTEAKIAAILGENPSIEIEVETFCRDPFFFAVRRCPYTGHNLERYCIAHVI